MAVYDVGGPPGPAGPAGGTGPPPPPPGPPHRAPRQLRRSRSNRVVAGVAGGLGRYAGVDPVVFRVSFVVLTVFGGAGLLLYLVGWLIIPDETDAVSPAEALVGRGRSSTSTLVAVLLVVGAAAALAAAVSSGGDSLTALALAVVAVVLLLRRQEGGDRAPRSGPPAAGPVTGGGAPVPSLLRLGETAAVLASEAERARVAELVTAACGAGLLGLEEADRRLARIFASRTRGQLAEVVAELPPEWVDGWERDAAVPPPVPPAPLPPPAAVAPAPSPRHERSALGWATLSLLAVALGVTIALDVGATQMLAVATGVVGAGLLVGAWYGRARWLALLGIPLALATVVASALPVDVHGGAGTRTFRPVDTAAISSAYRLGAGEVTLDLGGVVFDGRSARTAVEVGAGQVRVLVPPRVDVTVRARAGIGRTQVFGSRDAGLGVDRASTDDGPDGPGGGQLDLTASVGVGQVEVLRAAS